MDFFCPEAKLVIELDGGQHAEQTQEDMMRTAYLENAGYRVLRFWNNEVMADTDAVLERIAEAAEPPLTLTLSLAGRGDKEAEPLQSRVRGEGTGPVAMAGSLWI